MNTLHSLLWLRRVFIVSLLASLSISISAAPVVVETTTQGIINGFELYGDGLFWWNTGQPKNEVDKAILGQVGIRTLLAGRFLIFRNSATVMSVQSYDVRAPYQSVGRNENYLFCFSDSPQGKRIFRRPLFGEAADNRGNDMTGVSYDSVDSVLVSGNTFYWAVRGGAASASGEIRSKAVDALPGGGEAILGSGMGAVKKMKEVDVLGSDGRYFRSFLYLLNTSGEVWRIGLPSLNFPRLSAPTLLASGVTDFDVRSESSTIFSPTGLRTVHGTYLYAATGVNLTSSRLSGRVVAFNLTDGTSFTFYDTKDVNLQVTGVVLDAERIFITRTPLVFQGNPGGFGGYVYDQQNGQILRQNYAADRSFSVLSSMETVAIQQIGGNLRSDGQWLYFTHGNQIRKLKTDALPLALDYRAVGLEVVQAVQDYNNSVPLVAGKPTLVRGYAQQLQNTTGIAAFPLAARLRAFRGGALLPGEAWSQNSPVVDGAADLATLRQNINRSFLFDLPPDWLSQDGAIQIEFTVNPNGTAPETGAAPLLNNSAMITASSVHKGTPCVIFTVMSSTFPNYDPSSPGSQFGDILDRALTQLPVPDMRWGIRSGSFTKPEFTFLGIKERSFEIPADTSWALTLLSVAQTLSHDPEGCPDTHWAGMFPSAENGFNGQGEAPGNTLILRMGAENPTSWTGPRGGFALAHELSHNYGRNHINTPTNCTSQVPLSPYDSYIGSPCTLGGSTDLKDPATPIGYDYRTGTLILPTMAGDLMSYASTRWTSPQTWARNLSSISSVSPPPPMPALADLPPGGPLLFVQGLLNTSIPSAVFLPVIEGQPADFDSAKVDASLAATAALPANAPYRLEQIDASGNVLVDVPAVTSGFTDEPADKLKFAQFVALDNAMVRLRLTAGGNVITEIARSANPPSLVLGIPLVDEVNHTLSLAWDGSDADNDPLLFTVQFSPDNGSTWQTLAVHDPGLSFATALALLPGGDACRIRVIATDGLNTTMAVSDAFVLAKHAPFITVAGLVDGQHLAYGTAASVRAFAYDAEDGSIDRRTLHWSLEGVDHRSADGGVFSLAHLAPGAHSLVISTTDSDGNPGTRTLSFEVDPPSVPDTAAPVMDGLCVDSGYAGAPSARLFADLPEPTMTWVHANGSLYVCFNGLPRSEDNATPANINFYINADAAASDAPQADDYGFGVDENGVPFESRGNGAGLGAVLPLDFSVKIQQSVGAWSAEFRIPDALLGGWNHPARLMTYFGRSSCVNIPFLGCLSTPDAPRLWPETADLSLPGTWALMSFGPLSPRDNTAPVAVAYGPSAVSFVDAQAVVLDGSASYDVDGNAMTFAWTQTDGPAVALDDAAAMTPTFLTPSLSAPASVTFQLVVNDGQADSVPATVTIPLIPRAGGAASGGNLKTPILLQTDGTTSIQLCWPGAAGDMVVVQASTNLVDWENLVTNSVSFLGIVLHHDLDANAYPERFYRAVSWSPERTPAAGGALEFDGVDDRVEIPHASDLNPFPLTVTAWVKTTQISPGYVAILNKYVGGSGDGYSVHLHNGRVAAFYFRGDHKSWVYPGDPGLDGGFIADGQWHHVAFVVDASGGYIYIDSFLTASLGWTGVAGGCTTTAPILLGIYPLNGQVLSLAGDLDELSLWNRALNDAEIQSMMGHDLRGDETDLIGTWNFDEADGETVLDHSGHGHGGTLLNGTTRITSDAPIY